MYKSRYDSVSCFISTDERMDDSLNDIELPIDQETYDILLKEGKFFSNCSN